MSGGRGQAGGGRQDDDLGQRLADMERVCREARQTADQAFTHLTLMRVANEIADAAETGAAFGSRYLQHLCSALRADGAALLRNDASAGGFVTAQHWGAVDVPQPVVPPAAAPEYDIWPAAKDGPSMLDAYSERCGHHSLAWAWRPAENIALILVRGQGRVGEPTFSAVDQPTLQTALAIYAEGLRRRQSLDAVIAEKEAAERANAAKSRFLAMMSHELRTPLNSILGYAEMITTGLVGPPANPKTQESAEIIHASGLHLLGIITDILDISRVEAGKLELDDAPADLDALIRRAIEMVRRQAAAGGVGLTVERLSAVTRVRVDRRLILQALTNLITNAVKFSDRGSEVVVRTTDSADGGLDIAVRDTGPGMSERDVGIALQPFGQVDGGQRRQGIGLGLPLAKSFIKEHGGRLSIDSRPGEGTNMILRLPAGRVLGGPGVAPEEPDRGPGTSAS